MPPVGWRRARAVPPVPAADPSRPEFLTALDGPLSWSSLAHRAGAALPGAEVVKLVVDVRRTPWVPYFLDTVRYQHHVDFCRRLDPRVDARFDQEMYRSEERPFVLLTMTRLPGGAGDVAGDVAGGAGAAEPGAADERWWVEMWPGDTLAAARVVEVVELLRTASGLGGALRFRAASDDQRRRLEQLPPDLRQRLGPLLDQSAIHRGVRFQSLTTGTAHGRLRVLRAHDLPEGLGGLTPYDVVVAATVPLEIGPVAGLVTAEHQTPLAHVAVLSAGRGTPNCAVLGAHALPEVRALEGQWVRLEVSASSWSLEPVEESVARAAVEARLAAMRAGAPTLVRDVRRGGLPRLDERASRDPAVVGAKAAALARLPRRLRRYRVPGFSVPVSAYVAHVETAPAVQSLLAELDRADAGDGSVTEVLARLRAAIRGLAVDPALLAGIRAGIGRWTDEAPLFAGHTDVILRSSSNCEDLPGFNGAGLADSVRLAAGDLADRLLEVWASLWTDRAHLERSAFGIARGAAAMAVLVQPVVPHAAHVVAVTADGVRPGAIDAYLLNLLPAGALVTDAAGAVAEQLYLLDDQPACAEVLTLAVGQDASLLPDRLLDETRDVLKRVDRWVRAGSGAAGADVELLLLDAPRDVPQHDVPLVLLQARPWGVVGG